MGAQAWMRTWGATADEIGRELPGDDLLPDADVTTTRAISSQARPQDVWPWIAQLGQGRGRFYSYDAVANLAGCRIHSADHIEPDWQDVHADDAVRLQPRIAMTVADVEPLEHLVLRVPRDAEPPAPFDFTWSFVIVPNAEGTRLLVRERYRHTRRWSAVATVPVQLISFVMHRKMLRGLAERARRTTPREAL